VEAGRLVSLEARGAASLSAWEDLLGGRSRRGSAWVRATAWRGSGGRSPGAGTGLRCATRTPS
jgi:hypothetical protein